MALSRTNLLGQISGTAGNFGTGNFVTNSFTPPNNSVVVVEATLIENNGTTTDPTSAFTISDSGSHTWTEPSSGGNFARAVSSPTSFPTCTKTWTTEIATGASITLTFSAGGRSVGVYAVSVVAYTGYNVGSPTGAVANGQQNGGFAGPPTPFSITLNAATLLTSEVFAAAGMDKSVAGASPGTTGTCTEIDDLENTDWGGIESQVRASTTSTTVDWADLRSGGGALFNVAVVAVEILAATSTAPIVGSFSTPIHPGKGPSFARFIQTPKSTFVDPGPIVGYFSTSNHPGIGTSRYARFTKTSQGIIISATPDQAVSPIGISSSEAVGFQSVTLNVALQGIGTSETLGSAQVIQNLAPQGIASTGSIGFPSVAQVTTIAPNAINSAETLGNVSVVQNVAPQGIGTSESFGVAALSLNVAIAGIQSQEAFGSPAVANVSTIAPVGIPPQEALGQIAVSLTLLPTGIPSTEQFGTIQTTLTVSPVGIPSQETLGSATVQNVTTIAPIGIQAQERLGIPSISLNISAIAVSTNEAFGNPSVTAGAVTVSPVGIGTQEVFGVPSVSQVTTVAPIGVPTQERLGLPSVSLNLAPIGISSNESLGSPSITTGAVTVQAYGIPTQTQFGSFTITATGPGFVVITYGIPTSSAVGFPNIYRAPDVEVVLFGKTINAIMEVPTDVINVEVATAQAP